MVRNGSRQIVYLELNLAVNLGADVAGFDKESTYIKSSQT
jgi:hypothetical protein